jgi:DNA invertase Pin-like site-specific DNA recombinase
MRPKQKFFPEPGREPRIYPYGRVSHASQLKGADARDTFGSLPEQETRLRAYIAYMLLPGRLMTGAIVAGMFLEPLARSAFTKPFRSRPEGRKIMDRILPGDHLVVDKFDRLFRDQHDFVTMRRWFDERGITVHFVEFMGMSGTMNSRAFRMICSIKAIFAEDESENTSERVCMARSSLRAAGKDDGTPCPFFCRFAGEDPTKKRGHTGKRVMFEWAVPTMEKITFLTESERLGPDKIACILKKDKTLPDLNWLRCRKLYRFYKAWNAAGRPDINTLKVSDFVNAYWTRIKWEKADASPPLESSVGPA